MSSHSTKIQQSLMRRLWKISIKQYIPYYGDEEDEPLLVDWVEKGIHPLTGECFGPKAQRSVFDYLTDEELDEVIELQKTFLCIKKN